MNPTTSPAMPDAIFALTLALLLLAPLAIAGVALINAGLGRSRSAAQALLGNLAIVAVTAIVFALVGSAFAGALPGGAGHIFHLAGKPWNWLGTGPFLLSRPRHSPRTIATYTRLRVPRRRTRCLDSLGFRSRSLAPRRRLRHRRRPGRFCLSPRRSLDLGRRMARPVGRQLLYSRRRIRRIPRRRWRGHRSCARRLERHGRHLDRRSPPRQVPQGRLLHRHARPQRRLCPLRLPHLPCRLDGLESAGAILWLKAPLAALPLTAINTLLSASAALAATFTVTRVRFGKPDASLCANGWMAGLVASSACAALVSPIASLFVGMVAGIATPLLVELFELALSVDDPSGAISVHAAAGLWGLVAAGIFAPQPGQFIAQMVGIATLLGVFLPLVYLLFWLLNRVVPFRVDPDGERIGMDLHELGGGAYPEFVIHRDESYR